MYDKPRVLISKCLGFASCRYNGQTIEDQFVSQLAPFVEVITTCPEMEIGLGVPRKPIRIVSVDNALRLIQPATGAEVTAPMKSFTKEFIASVGSLDGCILKNRSPSCGIGDVKIYEGIDNSSRTTKGSGFFGGAIQEQFPFTAIEDEGRLRNFTIRDHFLVQLFTFHRYRAVEEAGTIGALVTFHTRHKLLLLGYQQELYRKAGSIVANHEKLAASEVLQLYKELLVKILADVPVYTAMINSLQHAFGWVSDILSASEKHYFLEVLEEYRDERVPLSTVLHMLRSYAIRAESAYLQEQYLFEPYPRELISITDSGKGRDY